jgi:hypothetical protein
MTGVEAIDFLVRDGRVPQWIDVSVAEVRGEFTLIELACCGRFVAEEDRMYYHAYGMGPFGLKGPPLPPGYDPARPQKFDLHWLRERRCKNA